MSEDGKTVIDREIEPGQEWDVDLFRPEDAEGVCALFHAVYGANYPIKTYVDPDLLRAENAAGRVISSVARTAKGDIVGHNALFQSAPYKRIFETGAGLVHRHYRGGNGIFNRMIAHGIEVGGRDFGVELVYGEPVCNHVFSQRVCRTLDIITRAAEIDLMPAAAYSKEQSAVGERVSTLLCFRPISFRPQSVYLPAVYEKQLRFLYETYPEPRTFEVAGGKEETKPVSSRIESQEFSYAGVVRIAVWEIGADFAERIEAEISASGREDFTVFQCWLPLAAPAIAEAVETLRRQGFFFGGLLPRWFDADGLLMQKLRHPPCWDTINTHYDADRKVVDLARADWEGLR